MKSGKEREKEGGEGREEKCDSGFYFFVVLIHF
jgi:hypothetical protein